MNLTKKIVRELEIFIELENIIDYFSIIGIVHINPLVQENAGCLAYCNDQYDLRK